MVGSEDVSKAMSSQIARSMAMVWPKLSFPKMVESREVLPTSGVKKVF